MFLVSYLLLAMSSCCCCRCEFVEFDVVESGKLLVVRPCNFQKLIYVYELSIVGFYSFSFRLELTLRSSFKFAYICTVVSRARVSRRAKSKQYILITNNMYC